MELEISGRTGPIQCLNHPGSGWPNHWELLGCSSVPSAFPGPDTKFRLPILHPASLAREGDRILPLSGFQATKLQVSSQKRYKSHSPPLPTLRSEFFSALGEILNLLEWGFIHEVEVGVSIWPDVLLSSYP